LKFDSHTSPTPRPLYSPCFEIFLVHLEKTRVQKGNKNRRIVNWEKDNELAQ